MRCVYCIDMVSEGLLTTAGQLAASGTVNDSQIEYRVIYECGAYTDVYEKGMGSYR